MNGFACISLEHVLTGSISINNNTEFEFGIALLVFKFLTPFLPFCPVYLSDSWACFCSYPLDFISCRRKIPQNATPARRDGQKAFKLTTRGLFSKRVVSRVTRTAHKPIGGVQQPALNCRLQTPFQMFARDSQTAALQGDQPALRLHGQCR